MGFNEELGIQLAADGAVRLEPDPRHEVAPGTIHFAALATLGEVAAARAAAVTVSGVVPVHLSVQLLRRASAEAPLEARGRLLKAGRSLVFAEGEVTQDGETVALVAATFARVG